VAAPRVAIQGRRPRIGWRRQQPDPVLIGHLPVLLAVGQREPGPSGRDPLWRPEEPAPAARPGWMARSRLGGPASQQADWPWPSGLKPLIQQSAAVRDDPGQRPVQGFTIGVEVALARAGWAGGHPFMDWDVTHLTFITGFSQSGGSDRGSRARPVRGSPSVLKPGRGDRRPVEGIHHLAGAATAGPLDDSIPPAADPASRRASGHEGDSVAWARRSSAALSRKNVLLQMSQLCRPSAPGLLRVAFIPGWIQSGPQKLPRSQPGSGSAEEHRRVVEGQQGLAGCVQTQPSPQHATQALRSKRRPLPAFTLEPSPQGPLHPKRLERSASW